MSKDTQKIVTASACIIWVYGIIANLTSSHHDYLNDFLWINIGGLGIMYLLASVRMSYLEDKEFAETEPERKKLQKRADDLLLLIEKDQPQTQSDLFALCKSQIDPRQWVEILPTYNWNARDGKPRFEGWLVRLKEDVEKGNDIILVSADVKLRPLQIWN